jgi:hypothetical protein
MRKIIPGLQSEIASLAMTAEASTFFARWRKIT